MTHRVKLGIIGTGIAARDLHLPALQRLQDRFEIVALCNRSPEKAEEFNRLIGGTAYTTTDYRELLAHPEVEAVDLALPIALNSPVGIDALRAGKHVIVEKPVAATVAAGRLFVEEARARPGQTVVVAENVRYDPLYRQAQNIVVSGTIGQPVLLLLDVLAPLLPGNPYRNTTWRQHPEHIGGYLSDGGVHQAAKLGMLMGNVTSVHGFVTSFHPDSDPTDTMVATVRFSSGAVAGLTLSVGVARSEPSPLRIHGTDGSLEIHDQYILIRGRDAEQRIEVEPLPNGFDGEFIDLYDGITAGKRPDCGPDEGLSDLRLIDAVLRSSEENRGVTTA